MDNHIHSLAEKIWHYYRMNHQLKKSDAILVLCSYDKRVAEGIVNLTWNEMSVSQAISIKQTFASQFLPQTAA